MRRLLMLTFAALAFALVASGAATAASFVFKGGGWGHGVGLAQWGAEGFARNHTWN